MQSTIPSCQVRDIRSDCIASSAASKDIQSGLLQANIAVTGGTGYLGTWLAEMIVALNDEFKVGINLHIYARNVSEWKARHQHLSSRSDVKLHIQDVRSAFSFEPQITHVIHAAGIPNNRIHSSNPLRVYQTIVSGAAHVLEAASQLNKLVRFVNVSSGLVNGLANNSSSISEDYVSPIFAGQLHNVYVDAKRSAESLAAIYRSQFKMPVSTVRPFTFVGPYQSLACPWAINNFLSDAIANRPIRINGDGSVRRSYLYGSDAAFWMLAALVKGVDGGIYNIGSSNPISHKELAQIISSKSQRENNILVNTSDINSRFNADFYPDISNTKRELQISETYSLEEVIERTLRWFSRVQA